MMLHPLSPRSVVTERVASLALQWSRLGSQIGVPADSTGQGHVLAASRTALPCRAGVMGGDGAV
jgi:hypothetical protein